jgi:hypothetical protein
MPGQARPGGRYHYLGSYQHEGNPRVPQALFLYCRSCASCGFYCSDASSSTPLPHEKPQAEPPTPCVSSRRRSSRWRHRSRYRSRLHSYTATIAARASATPPRHQIATVAPAHRHRPQRSGVCLLLPTHPTLLLSSAVPHGSLLLRLSPLHPPSLLLSASSSSTP